MNFDNAEYDEKIGELRLNTKKSPGQIAQVIDMSNEFVYFRLKKMGLPVNKATKLIAIEGFKAAYENGTSYPDMTREFGITGSAGSRIARRLGLARRKRFNRNDGLDDNILIQKYVGEFWPITRIAEAYGWKTWNVRERLKDLGVLRGLSENNAVKRERRRQGTGLPFPVDRDGYPIVRSPDDHQNGRKTGGGLVHSHVLEMEMFLGRPLGKGEIVHHIDNDKMNFNIDNLYLCKSGSEHRLIHGTLERVSGPLLHAGILGFKLGYGYYIKRMPKEEDLIDAPESPAP